MAPSADWMVVDLVSLVLAKVFIGHFLKQVVLIFLIVSFFI